MLFRWSLRLRLPARAPACLHLLNLCQKLVGRLHGHAAEVGDEMSAIRVTGNPAFAALFGVLSTKREHITAVTTPVSANVRDSFEPVRDTMVDLVFVVLLI